MPPVIEYAKDLPTTSRLVAVPVTIEQGDADGLAALGSACRRARRPGLRRQGGSGSPWWHGGRRLGSRGRGPRARRRRRRGTRCAAPPAWSCEQPPGLLGGAAVARRDRRRHAHREGGGGQGGGRGRRARRLPLHRAPLRPRSVRARAGRRRRQGRQRVAARGGRGRAHRRGPEPGPRPGEHPRRDAHARRRSPRSPSTSPSGRIWPVTVLGPAEIAERGLGGLLGVNRGSQQEPRFVELAYEPANPRGTLALVGKGITFDSGGLSIKTGDGHDDDEDGHGRCRGRARLLLRGARRGAPVPGGRVPPDDRQHERRRCHPPG